MGMEDQWGNWVPAGQEAVAGMSLANINGGNPLIADPSLLEQLQGYGNSLMNGLNNVPWLKQTRADGSTYGGVLGAGLGAIQGFGNLYLGMKQYGLAKDQLAFSKDAFAKNFAAQAKMTNASLADRQAARVASNAGAYESVGNYMSKYGV